MAATEVPSPTQNASCPMLWVNEPGRVVVQDTNGAPILSLAIDAGRYVVTVSSDVDVIH